MWRNAALSSVSPDLSAPAVPKSSTHRQGYHSTGPGFRSRSRGGADWPAVAAVAESQSGRVKGEQ